MIYLVIFLALFCLWLYAMGAWFMLQQGVELNIPGARDKSVRRVMTFFWPFIVAYMIWGNSK